MGTFRNSYKRLAILHAIVVLFGVPLKQLEEYFLFNVRSGGT